MGAKKGLKGIKITFGDWSDFVIQLWKMWFIIFFFCFLKSKIFFFVFFGFFYLFYFPLHSLWGYIFIHFFFINSFASVKKKLCIFVCLFTGGNFINFVFICIFHFHFTSFFCFICNVFSCLKKWIIKQYH